MHYLSLKDAIEHRKLSEIVGTVRIGRLDQEVPARVLLQDHRKQGVLVRVAHQGSRQKASETVSRFQELSISPYTAYRWN